MIIYKTVVIAVLLERGQLARADFVERELREHIDTCEHDGLPALLHLEPATPSRSTSS
jgi:hypothetical protein